MACTVLCCVLLALFLRLSAAENRPQHSDAAAEVDDRSNKLAREEALLQLAKHVKDSDSDLKERLQRVDSLLKERMLEGEARVKEQLKETKEELKDGDARLKEELDDDVAWLKQIVTKGQGRVNWEISQMDTHITKQLTEQRKDFEELQGSDKTCSQQNQALTDDLKQQMSDFRAELNSTKILVQTMQTELNNTKNELQTTQTELSSTKNELQTTQTELSSTKNKLQTTQTELSSTKILVQTMQTELNSTKILVQTMQTELNNTKNELQTTQTELNSTKNELQMTQSELTTNQRSLQLLMLESSSSDSGSTFIRWGRSVCPENASLVYAGLAGGTNTLRSGGASNYLCLVMVPQLTKTDNRGNFVYGVEYQHIQGHHEQDAVCSVCRAPQATTLMIPATLTCPAGWTTQYKGLLVSEHRDHVSRTEYVCLDEAAEHREGGKKHSVAASFYQVSIGCESLPCPPYDNGAQATCVVCSM